MDTAPTGMDIRFAGEEKPALTEEEKKLLDESVRDEGEGRLASLEELRNVRNKAR